MFEKDSVGITFKKLVNKTFKRTLTLKHLFIYLFGDMPVLFIYLRRCLLKTSKQTLNIYLNIYG